MRGAQGLRNAFSLVELLVVIAIIAVLMAILSAAVFPMLFRGPEVMCRHEMSQLEVALTAMQNDFKLRSPPPAVLYLSNSKADYDDAASASPTLPYPNLRKNSRAFLQRLFPRMD